MDAGHDASVDLAEKLSPPDAYCAPDAAGGGGLCPINYCGQPKSVKVLQAGEVAELGGDVTCTPGYSCVPDGPTASGDALQLRCVQPLAAAVAFGQPCTKGAGTAMRCKNDALCIEAADMPGAPFCSVLCRADGDCPVDAYCLEYKSAALPNGSFVNLGMCTPKGKINGTVCTSEAGCPADQGCVSYGARSHLLICKKIGGAKSMGEACTAASECRSGECFDREFHVPAAGNRAYCSGNCAKNSDCSADQRCVRVVLTNNNTPADPFDDVVAGYCQALFVPAATAACKDDGDCTVTGATCSTKYGLCYKAGVATGAPCTGDQGCEFGAVCATGLRFPDGYCQTTGCAAGVAAGSVDACPGVTSVCSQRASDEPLHACYEGCTKSGDCSRAAQNYVCAQPKKDTGVPLSICLFDQGV
jgi:hypothetical protein